MKVQLYGIPNCDTVKKARAWFAEQGIEVAFHDFKKAGVPAEALDAWVAAVGWERLLNRQGNTWRRLDDATRAAAADAAGACALMRAQPSVIKRPVVVWPAAITVGFTPTQWPPAAGRGAEPHAG
ncbi:MAG: Spx/MgsR family RNA polymerase-binding regulatory protein [Burkholderiales bacterium]|nr:Spx/MgsR family RNA polymerase-binding regulatory protein [Burkholderiales bacterium]